jgi:hypothetical protein
MAYQAMVTKNNPLKNSHDGWSLRTIRILLHQKLEAIFLFIDYSSMKSA